MRLMPADRIRSLVLLAPWVLAFSAGCAQPGVVRVIDGREVEGRFVSESAYAAYGRAAAAEARGDLGAALAGYAEAAADDSASPEIWTRIGAVACGLGRAAAADDAFRRAASRDADYEPLWRERARCALAAGRIPEALESAAKAIALDPDRSEAAVLHAVALERAGRVADARRELVALTLRQPRSLDGWRALAELSARAGDRAGAERAAVRARELGPRLAGDLERSSPALAPLAEVDAALGAGDLGEARRRAKRAHMTPSELAARAAAAGRPALAREQAELVLGADPADATARVALAVAADLAGDDDAVDAAMRGVEAQAATPPSPLARLLFAELLARRVGTDAARAWLGDPPAAAAGDALHGQVAGRVRERLW